MNLERSPTIGEFRVVTIVPVYRDWESATILCRSIDLACACLPEVEIRIVLVDDGSPDYLAGWAPFTPESVRSIEVVRLKRNLGHQRAIATGLCYVHDSAACDAVAIMDGDGEDRPEDLCRLIARVMERRDRIVFAGRRKRLESGLFRIGYHLYRWLHRALTGIPVRVGNFSIVPFSCLARLTCMSETWNHYAGAVFRSKLAFDCIPMDRGRRYCGRSKMDFVSLVNHGLAGIAAFHDVAATRILIVNLAAMVFAAAALAGVVGIRLFTSLAIPGWATFSTGLLLVLLMQLAAASFSLVFTLIVNRANLPLIPARDYQLFVERVETLTSVPHEPRLPSVYR